MPGQQDLAGVPVTFDFLHPGTALAFLAPRPALKPGAHLWGFKTPKKHEARQLDCHLVQLSEEQPDSVQAPAPLESRWVLGPDFIRGEGQLPTNLRGYLRARAMPIPA